VTGRGHCTECKGRGHCTECKVSIKKLNFKSSLNTQVFNITVKVILEIDK
jgi:ferredoxin